MDNESTSKQAMSMSQSTSRCEGSLCSSQMWNYSYNFLDIVVFMIHGFFFVVFHKSMFSHTNLVYYSCML